MHSPENIARMEEKENGSVEIKLKRHLFIYLSMIKGIGDSEGTSRSLYDYGSNYKGCHTDHILMESAVTTAGYICSWREQKLYFRNTSLDTIKGEISKNVISYSSF